MLLNGYDARKQKAEKDSGFLRGKVLPRATNFAFLISTVGIITCTFARKVLFVTWLMDKTEEGIKDIVQVSGLEASSLTVETIDNHVYFYSAVDSDRCLALIRAVRELDVRLRTEHISRMLPADYPKQPIWLHINSGGGYLFDGLGISDQLMQIESPIFSIVEGYAASAATLISLACTKRYILPSSFMLIHQLSGMAWGTYEQIKDEVKLLDMAMKRMVLFYTQWTKIKAEEVEELLRHDTWFDANECLERGLVDEILCK